MGLVAIAQIAREVIDRIPIDQQKAIPIYGWIPLIILFGAILCFIYAIIQQLRLRRVKIVPSGTRVWLDINGATPEIYIQLTFQSAEPANIKPYIQVALRSDAPESFIFSPVGIALDRQENEDDIGLKPNEPRRTTGHRQIRLGHETDQTKWWAIAKPFNDMLSEGYYTITYHDIWDHSYTYHPKVVKQEDYHWQNEK
ncbi:MAG: hypothetical protein ABSG90_09890 [Dehalococcoidia bacterium]